MLDIRREVSKIVGIAVPPKNYAATFETLGREGKISQKQIIQLIALLLENETQKTNRTD